MAKSVSLKQRVQQTFGFQARQSSNPSTNKGNARRRALSVLFVSHREEQPQLLLLDFYSLAKECPALPVSTTPQL